MLCDMSWGRSALRDQVNEVLLLLNSFKGILIQPFIQTQERGFHFLVFGFKSPFELYVD